MCGIVGYVGDKNASQVLINALKKLEYRVFGSGEKSHVAPVGKSQILTNKKNQNYPSYTSFLE